MSCTISSAKATLAFCYSKLLLQLASFFFVFYFLKRHWTVISCWTIFKNCYHVNPLLFLWLQDIEKLHSVISNLVISGPNFLWNPWASTIWSWHLVTLFITLLYKLLCWQFKQRQIFQWVLFSIKRISGIGTLFGLLDSSMGNRNAHKSSNFLLMASSPNISFTSSSIGSPKSSTFLVSDELGNFFFLLLVWCF